MLAVAADGKQITHHRRASPRDGDLHPLQKAFVKHGALQCGFCTPGMLMSAKALLDRNPHPDRDEIKEALGGNLCRCAAYPRIIRGRGDRWKEFEGQRLDTAPHEHGERDQVA